MCRTASAASRACTASSKPRTASFSARSASVRAAASSSLMAGPLDVSPFSASRDDYATARKEFGRVWRKHCGKHYPGMAMFQVVSLFDPDARIEVQGIAAR